MEGTSHPEVSFDEAFYRKETSQKLANEGRKPSLVSSSLTPSPAPGSATQPILSTSGLATTASNTSPPNLSFPDPGQENEKPFELFLRTLLPPSVSTCRGYCGEAITPDVRLLVKTIGHSKYCDAATRENKVRV